MYQRRWQIPYCRAVVTCVLFVPAFCGCAAPPDPRLSNFRVERDNVVAQYDEKSGRLKRLEVDTDKNGKFDAWTYMDGTRIDRIEIDRDEDGKIERWEYYGPNAKLEKVGTSSRGDGVVDEWAFQGPDGFLLRVETDTDRNGRIDKWQHFDPPRTSGGSPTLREVAFDVEGVGHPTERLLYGPEGEFRRREPVSAGVPR
jgi:hypothetical protein